MNTGAGQRLFCLALILAICFALCSAQIYVSTTGSDSNSGNSSSQAFQTMDHACSVASGLNQTMGPLFVLPGSYFLSVTCSLYMDIIAPQSLVTITHVGPLGVIRLIYNSSFVFEPFQLANISFLAPALNDFPVGIYGDAFIDSISISGTMPAALVLIPADTTLTASLTNSQISAQNNDFTPTQFGGAILTENVILTMDNVQVTNCLQYQYGAVVIFGTAANVSISNSLFSGNSATYSGGAITMDEALSLQIVNTVFEYNMVYPIVSPNIPDGLGWNGGAITAVVIDQIIISGCTFKNNNADNSSAIFVGDASIAEIANTVFESNVANMAATLRITGVSQYIFNNVTFDSNVAQSSPVFIIQSASGVITLSTFQNNVGTTALPDSSAVLTFAAESPGFVIDLVENTFSNNSVQFGSDVATVTDVYVEGPFVINFDSNIWLTTPSNVNYGSVGIANEALLVISPYSLNPAFIPGLTVSCANVSLQSTLTLSATSLFVNPIAITCPTLNMIDANGNTLFISTPKGAVSWLQSFQPINGTVQIQSGTSTICCDIAPSTTSMGTTLIDTQLTVSTGSTLNIQNSATPMYMDSNSLLTVAVAGNLYFYSLFPAQVYGNIDNYGRLYAYESNLFGNLDLFPSSVITLYPSNWRGTSHPFNVSGAVSYQGGSIALFEEQAILPFTPIVSLSDPPAAVLNFGNFSNIAGVDPKLDKIHSIDYTINMIGNTFYASPTGLLSRGQISNDASAVIFEFTLPVNFNYLSDCLNLIANSPTYNFADWTCTWTSPTTLEITGQNLPRDGTQVQFTDGIGPVHTSSLGILRPSKPLPPVAIIKPLPANVPCNGSVVLDASLSTGIGVYSAVYSWTVSSSDTLGVSNIQSLLNTSPARTMQVPVTMFNAGFGYSFTLRILNYLNILSPGSNVVNITASTTPTFSVSVEGAITRNVYVGTDLSITGRIITDSACPYDTSSLTWNWYQVVNGIQQSLPNGITTNLLTLNVPASFITLAGNAIYRLVVTQPSSPSGTTIDVNVTILEAPFSLHPFGRNFFSGEDVILDSYLALSGPVNLTYTWTFIECPNNYAESSFPIAVSNGTFVNLAGDCVDSAGVAFAFPFSTTDQSSTTIPMGSIGDGTYTVQLKASDSLSGTSDSFQTTFTYLSGVSKRASMNILPAPKVMIVAPTASYAHPNLGFYFYISIDGVSGPSLASSYNWTWAFDTSPSASNSATLQNLLSPTSPFVYIPHSLLNPRQILTLNVYAQARVINSGDIALISNASYTVSFSEAPTGGSLIASPSSGGALHTVFTLSAPLWSTLYSPLSYQFYLVLQDGSQVSLAELTSSDSISIVALAAPYISSGVPTNVTLQVQVFDALGASSTAQTIVTINPDNSTLDVDIPFIFSFVLPAAINASDWRSVNQIMIALSFIIEDPDADIVLTTSQISLVLNASLSLQSQLPLDFVNTATVLSSLNRIITALAYNSQYSDAASSSTSLLSSVLSTLASAPNSQFGVNSAVANFSTTNFFSLATQLLSGAPELAVTITQFINSAAASMTPGQSPITLVGGNVGTSSGLASASSTSIELSTFFDPNRTTVTSISFDPSSYAGASVQGNLAYAVTIFNQTFPNLPDNAFPVVVSTTIFPPTNTSLPSNATVPPTQSQQPGVALSGGQSATFNTGSLLSQQQSNNQQASCSSYNQGSGSWSSDGCTTNTDPATGEVSCTCSSGSPMAVLFGPFQAPGSKNFVLSAAAIAGIVVAAVVILSVTIFVIMVLTVPAIRGLFIKTSRYNRSRTTTAAT